MPRKKKNNLKNRGFGALKKRDPEKLLEITAKGGRTAHARGVAHSWSSEAARIAGKKGLESRNAKSNRANA